MQKNNCLLTIDVEEWFQVENLREAKPAASWEQQASSIEKNVKYILRIMDKEKIKATFFILGYIAQRHPELVKQIHRAGHEVASHGTGHQHTSELNKNELVADIKKSKDSLESIIGEPVKGYRAPNFSVSDKVIDVLKELGFEYDSSYNPFQLHKRYGTFEKYKVVDRDVFNLDDDFYEFPISTTKFFKKPFPIGGGAYFRIYPFWFFKKLALKKLNESGIYNFYLHPWEFEPEQPRVKDLSLNHRLRHYTGLHKTEGRFKKLITALKKQNCRFMTISEYLVHIIHHEAHEER